MTHQFDACVHCGLPVPRSRQGDDVAGCFCCFGCRLAHGIVQGGGKPADTADARGQMLFLRLGAGVFLTLNIMVFSYFFYSQELYPTETGGSASAGYQLLVGVLAYLQMFLATIVMALLGGPLALDSVGGLLEHLSRRGRLRADANLLILTGVAAAYVLSVIHAVRGDTRLYFDTACVILVLVTLGSYLDSGAKRRATEAARALLQSIPDRAWVQRGDEVVEVDAEAVQPGDRVRCRPGEWIAVDGTVLEGRSHVTESSLTGEFRPRSVGPEDTVLAGGSNVDGLLWIRAGRVGEQRTIAQLQRLLYEARQRQPAIQRAADAVAAVFVPAVMILAVVVFAVHAWRVPEEGLFNALSVLLISCPCALGLTAPLATWCAMAHAAARGILFQSGQILERAAAVTDVCYDKTGTLTTGQMRLDPKGSGVFFSDHDLAIAAAVESASTHPVALALLDEARRRGLAIDAPTDARVLPGLGVEAVVNGTRYRLGSPRLLPDAQPTDALRIHLVEVTCDGVRARAHFDLEEDLRSQAPAAVHWHRRMGHRVEILSGDQPGPVQRIAAMLGVTAHAGLLPQQKLDHLESLRQRRRGDRSRVAMVGDGINDAPALAAADVGVAMAGGSDLARQAGHVLIVGDNLLRVPEALAIARHTLRRIRLNLVWAFSYNTIGITLAALGYLTPVFAASSMIVSSLLIVTTSSGAGKTGNVQCSNSNDE